MEGDTFGADIVAEDTIRAKLLEPIAPMFTLVEMLPIVEHVECCVSDLRT